MTMYLTKFPINMTRRETRFMLSSPYRMHAAIAGSFASVTQEQDGRVLWRIDHGVNNTASLYIVSPNIPSLVGLDEQIGWPDLAQQWQTRDYAAVLDMLKEGQIFNFRLVANPIVNRRAITDKYGRSKRLPHVTTLQQSAWLMGSDAYTDAQLPVPEYLSHQSSSRAERCGFEVVKDKETGVRRLAVSNTRTWSFKQGQGGNNIRLATAQYDGVLRVSDAGLMRHALTNGIGRGKGFGCGLLTIAPVESS